MAVWEMHDRRAARGRPRKSVDAPFGANRLDHRASMGYGCERSWYGNGSFADRPRPKRRYLPEAQAGLSARQRL